MTSMKKVSTADDQCFKETVGIFSGFMLIYLTLTDWV